MNGFFDLGWVRPDDRRLLAGVVGLQVALIALPMLWGVRLVWMVSGLLIGLGVSLFSVRRTLLALLVINIALPATVLSMLILPGGFRFQEGLFLAALGFALIDLIYCRDLRVRASAADGPVLVFLGVAVVSAVVGFLHDNLTTVILRDVRFPLYYAVFFLMTGAVDRRSVLRYFLPALVVAALLVSFAYILEFVGAIDLSVGSRFVRVARLQGIALPLALLFVVNQFIHHPGRQGRWVLVGLFLPISLAFVLTVGRGMWVACGVGLVTTAALWHLSRPAAQRRAWQAGLLIAALVGTIVVTAFVFQRFTGSAIGAHALERSRTFVDFGRDVHFLGRLSSYAIVLGEVVRYPLLGSGQGATQVFFIFNEELNDFGVHESWTVDSLYLALLWKMGLAGLLAFGWMVVRLLRTAYRTFRETADPRVRAFSGGAVAVIFGMSAMGLSDASMISGRFAMIFGILFGMIAVVAGGDDREGRDEAAE